MKTSRELDVGPVLRSGIRVSGSGDEEATASIEDAMVMAVNTATPLSIVDRSRRGAGAGRREHCTRDF